MELADLGFDSWFEEKRGGLQSPDFAIARVTRVDRDRYLVRNEHNEVQAEPTGKLIFSADSSQELPCVGDWVFVQYHNDGTLAIIHELFARRTFLRRKSAGNKVEYQMIASNIDVAFIMQSCDLNFNLRRMERYLVMVNEGHVEPVILLSKSDLVSAEELEKRISDIRDARINARIIAFSNKTEMGLEIVRQALQKGKTYCLLGSSGVGKTTLLNHLLGCEAFETNPVREKDSRGRHTTARRQMTVLDSGALLVDTPGIRELGMMAVSASVDESFSDIHELSKRCRFHDCTHSVEVGCAILDAVQSGALNEARYQSYLKLMKESEFHQMSYVQRRKKDRQFGRMIKTAMQQLKKRKPSS
ncbi:MAG: ribosome small subunit-dependent GTPase A [Ignavibacteriales bacterium]|nr:ribosome small subunit-dependent GTPase A [Ignavibacteriales bacterium]